MNDEEKRGKKQVRRARGEGSIHRRNDGRWAGSFLTEEGKRITVYGKSQQEALEKLRRSQYDYQQGVARNWSKANACTVPGALAERGAQACHQVDHLCEVPPDH